MTLRALLKDPNTTKIWFRSASNEFGRLMDGNKFGTTGTQTMTMVKPSDISQDKAITYASMVCDYHPLKTEPYRCRLVVRGDKLPYASDAQWTCSGSEISAASCTDTHRAHKSTNVTLLASR